MTTTRTFLCTILLAVPLSLASAAHAADTAKIGLVTGIANNQVTVAPEDHASPAVTCPLPEMQRVLGRAPEAGDRVNYVPEAGNVSCKIERRSTSISIGDRIKAIAVALVIVLGAATAAAGGVPSRLVLGADNRYSNSKCQLALWFGAAMTFYLAMIFLRVAHLGWDYLDGVSMTANVLTLTGLSALTFGAAKAVTAQKAATADTNVATPVANAAAMSAAAQGLSATEIAVVRKAAESAGAAKASDAVAVTLAAAGTPSALIQAVAGATSDAATVLIPKPSANKANLLTDLFQNDSGEVDIGDFQMIFVAVTAVAIFAVSCFNELGMLAYQVHVSLPDVDNSLLAGFGIGQGAYLVKKAAMPLGKG